MFCLDQQSDAQHRMGPHAVTHVDIYWEQPNRQHAANRIRDPLDVPLLFETRRMCATPPPPNANNSQRASALLLGPPRTNTAHHPLLPPESLFWELGTLTGRVAFF